MKARRLGAVIFLITAAGLGCRCTSLGKTHLDAAGVCHPRACSAISHACGPAPDGCGGFLSCGGCPAGELCGGAGQPNRCAQEPAAPPLILGAAGDIACDRKDRNFNGGAGTEHFCAQRATSDLLVALKPQAVLTLGDEQYPSGDLESFRDSFEPTWGRLKSVMHASPGNHEYRAGKADGYFEYFGREAGAADGGYYSFELGSWHIVSLNSNCDEVACGPDSLQVKWLKADLEKHPRACTLAFFHHPLFSSGVHGSQLEVRPLWDALYEAGADVVLNGHDHDYERFAPSRPDGTVDAERGLREFLIGTGGCSQYPLLHSPRANTEVRKTNIFGVLQLTLYPSHYSWDFLSTGAPFHDHGEGRCH